jgi:proteasome beta subunit
VFSYDVTGGRYEEHDYQCQGSGSVHARNWIKAGWREGMSLDDTVELAIRALFAAADEDAATGGPDLVRGIFPLVAAIDAAGFRALDEADVEQRSRALLDGRERGGVTE